MTHDQHQVGKVVQDLIEPLDVLDERRHSGAGDPDRHEHGYSELDTLGVIDIGERSVDGDLW